MIGISSSGKEAINKVVEEVFDTIALQFIGDIPKLKHKKTLIFNTKPNYGLAQLFVAAMEGKQPNIIEADALKSLLESSYGYIESLKSKTRSNVAERIDGIVKDAKNKNQKVVEDEIQLAIDDEMRKAKKNLMDIATSESTKIRNVGSAMDITRVAASGGDMDPSVFFVLVRDNVTCKECLRLHLNSDGTPRVWKLSELKNSYHKRGEDSPSVFGLHPHCRCTLTYLSSGFGFDKKGKVTYIGRLHDEYAKQRAA